MVRCRICARVRKWHRPNIDRLCNDCKLVLELEIHSLRPSSELYKRKQQPYQNKKDSIKKYRENNMDKIRAYQKKWRQNHSEYILNYQRQWRARKLLNQQKQATPLITVSSFRRDSGGES